MKPNDNYQFNYNIKTQDLAKSLSDDSQDDFPEVLATSRMIALMELAAARLMKPLLKTGELSVGVDVDVIHMAATPAGEMVTAGATFSAMKAKLYVFDVVLYDAGGLAGRGSHSRAIVKTERLLQGAAARINNSIVNK